MRTKLIYNSIESHQGDAAGAGDTERYEYNCLCGKGMIIEEHDNIPGFREHDVWINCECCHKKYKLDTSKGVGAWRIVAK